MKSRTADWFLCKIRYEKTTEDGAQKKVTEQYILDALSFAEAEARILNEMASYVSEGIEVSEIDRAAFKEVFFSDDCMDDKWYKAKLQFITIDEKSEKEKRTNVCYLVQGGSLEQARKNIDEVMSGTMIDYVIAAVIETKIMDVYVHSDSIITENLPGTNCKTKIIQ